MDRIHALLWASETLTVTPVLADAAGSTSTLEPVAASDRSFVSMWSLVLVVLLLPALAAVAWRMIAVLKRRRSASKPSTDLEVGALDGGLRSGLRSRDRSAAPN